MDIQISPQELRQYASEMESHISAMKEALEKATNVINGTTDSFKASSANAFRGKYNQLRSKFDLFSHKLSQLRGVTLFIKFIDLL